MLRNKFFADNGTRIHKFEKELEKCSQQSAGMIDYFEKHTTIWDELANNKKDPNYYCSGHTCARIADAERQQEEKRLYKFLIGLDNSFHTITSQILNANYLPSIDHVYSVVIQEENHYVIARKQRHCFCCKNCGKILCFMHYLQQTRPYD